MTAYKRFDPAIGNDTRPIDAHTAKHVVRGNLKALAENVPSNAGGPIFGGGRETTATTYDDSGSSLIRFPAMKIWIGTAGTLALTFRVRVAVPSGAGTAKVRVYGSSADVLPDALVVATGDSGYVISESSSFSGTTVVSKTMIMAGISVVNTYRSTWGSIADGPRANYLSIYLGLQGRFTSGTGTINVEGFHFYGGAA